MTFDQIVEVERDFQLSKKVRDYENMERILNLLWKHGQHRFAKRLAATLPATDQAKVGWIDGYDYRQTESV